MRRDRFVSAFVLVVAASLFPPMSAWALPQAPAGGGQAPAAGQGVAPEIAATPAAEGEEKTADQYALEGRELAQKGDLAGAYRAMLIAWDLKKSYDIAGNLGVVELQLGKARDAAEHLLFCKTNYPAVRDEGMTLKLQKLEELLAKARKDIGSVRIDVAAKDDADSDGAEVYVGDRLVGRSPIETEVFVDPGSYTIRVRLPGFGEQKQSVNVAKGATVGVKFVLVPAEVGPVGGGDGPPQRSMAVVGAGIGLAVAGIAVGGVFTVLSNGKSGDATSKWRQLRGPDESPNARACTEPGKASDCEELYGLYSSTAVFRNVAIAGFVTGGVAALATGAYVLFTRGSRSGGTSENRAAAVRLPVQASFGVSSSGGGVTLTGTF